MPFGDDNKKSNGNNNRYNNRNGNGNGNVNGEDKDNGRQRVSPLRNDDEIVCCFGRDSLWKGRLTWRLRGRRNGSRWVRLGCSSMRWGRWHDACVPSAICGG